MDRVHSHLFFNKKIDNRLFKIVGWAVFALKYCPKILPLRFRLDPSRDLFGHSVHAGHPAFTVSGHETRTNAGQGERQTLLDINQLLFCAAPLADFCL